MLFRGTVHMMFRVASYAAAFRRSWRHDFGETGDLGVHGRWAAATTDRIGE